MFGYTLTLSPTFFFSSFLVFKISCSSVEEEQERWGVSDGARIRGWRSHELIELCYKPSVRGFRSKRVTGPIIQN